MRKFAQVITEGKNASILEPLSTTVLTTVKGGESEANPPLGKLLAPVMNRTKPILSVIVISDKTSDKYTKILESFE